MEKKEKLVFYIVIICVLFFVVNKLLNIKNLSYVVKYKNVKFNIKENYNKKYYILEIKNNNHIYNFNIYDNLKAKRKIVNNIYYYIDKNYECILPIIDNKVLTDMMCYKGKVIYNYHTIKGNNNKLDKYVASIKEYNNNYENKDTYKEKETLKIYDNKIKNIVSIISYKGLYINSMPVNLFKKDVYSNKISIYINNYFLSANYNENHEFNSFYLVNLSNSEIDQIELKDPISFDSFIQGIVDNKVYLYDYDNEIQYEIDIYNKKVNVVSNNDYIKYYTNTKWEKLSKSKVKRNSYFDYSTLDKNFIDYDEVKETADYYYLFIKDGNNYKLYRVNKNNLNNKTYIGLVPTTEIKTNNDYFYYINGNKLFYYSDTTGIKTILEDSEIEFNETIKYYIY